INNLMVPVPVVPVVFWGMSPPFIIYINTYISISYVIFRREVVFHFLTGTTGTGTETLQS
ncbi:MAG: hypothetical protein IKQ12_03760, partial [Prevotella sp.]|nr:hypothetical protein [Prevotella sp.]